MQLFTGVLPKYKTYKHMYVHVHVTQKTITCMYMYMHVSCDTHFVGTLGGGDLSGFLSTISSGLGSIIDHRAAGFVRGGRLPGGLGGTKGAGVRGGTIGVSPLLDGRGLGGMGGGWGLGGRDGRFSCCFRGEGGVFLDLVGEPCGEDSGDLDSNI